MVFPAHATSGRLRKVLLVVVSLLSLVGVAGGAIGTMVAIAPATLRYHLRPGELEVEARLGLFDLGRRVPLASIRDARPVTLGAGRRTAGTARGDLCQGRWTFPELGEVWLATSCARAAVLLDTADRAVVISPADREAFLRALAAGATATFEAPAGASGAAPLFLLAFLPVLIVLPLLLLFLRVWTTPLVYRLEGATLIVPAHLRARRIALGGARIRRVRPGKFWRVAGTGLPGFYLGLYRLDGENVHAAATRYDEGVLIDDGLRPVFVTPADQAAFVQALEARGARVAGG